MQSVGKYCVERVQNESDLNGLAEAWAGLAERDPGVTIFSTFEWISTWWRHREPGWQLWLLTARDGQGRLAGLAPFVLYGHQYGPLHVRRLAFPGDSYAYRVHLDVIAAPEDRLEVSQAFLTYLRSRQAEWDVLDLEGLAAGSPLKDLLAGMGSKLHEPETMVCPYITLPDSWEAYEKSHLDAKFRQNLRARRRHLERDHAAQVTYKQVTRPEELPAAMDALAELHRRRWHARGQQSSFDHPPFWAFHREMAALALDRGWLRLYLLQVGDRVIAADYCFRYRDTIHDYHKAFDPAWSKYGPGHLIVAYALQSAIAEGAREFDTGFGDFDYKFSWADGSRTESHVAVGGGWTGHLWCYGGAAWRSAREVGRKILPESVRQKVNQRANSSPAPAPAAEYTEPG